MEVVELDGWLDRRGLGFVPLLFCPVQFGGQGCVELAALDGSMHAVPAGAGAETNQPTTVWRSHMRFFERLSIAFSMVKIIWITELSFMLDMPMISEAAATTTQKAGWARIASRCMTIKLCT